ncbi:MAG TPA: cysteine desulfurase family protein [Anaerolineae bacterium]|nr:cysteine desulfurase family protein [Anaerolineae bacterium]
MTQNKRRIYLDHAATTPVDVRVLEAMQPYWAEHFGNTSSIHSLGREAQQGLDQARQTVAEVLGCTPQEIVFTGCGTESDNLALRGVAFAAREAKRGNHLITIPIEHHAVGATVEQLRDLHGFDVTFVEVDQYGMVDPDAIEHAIRPDTILISVMYANNEVGTVQPLAEIGTIARAHGLPFHTDAVQAGGQMNLNVDRLKVDLLALSAHKFYGPKGVGVLYIRSGTELISALTGGGHERGRRPGTVNVAEIVGLAIALKLAQERRETENARVAALRDQLVAGVFERVPEVQLTGHPTRRLPNSASFAIKGVEGETLLMALDLEGICVSTGSACTTGEAEPSHVLLSMGFDREWALGSLRMTLGHLTHPEDIATVLDVLPRVVAQLRNA